MLWEEDSIFCLIFSHGYLGVEFFFMVSGFMIAYTYKEKMMSMSITNFLKRRIGSMYPAIFVTTILCAMLHKWELSLPSHLLYSNPLNLKTVISSLMLLSSSTFVGSDTPVNGALWYINALVICYIFYYFFACLYYNYGGKIYDFLCLFMICGGGVLLAIAYTFNFYIRSEMGGRILPSS